MDKSLKHLLWNMVSDIDRHQNIIHCSGTLDNPFDDDDCQQFFEKYIRPIIEEWNNIRQ